MHCLSDTRIARAYLRPLLANTCTDHGRVLPWEANSDSITRMLSVVHEANQNEFSAALEFKLPLLKTHILSPDSHGRSGVKLSLSSDIVGIRKHIHSQLCQVPSPYSVLLELFCQVTNPVGYHMPIMIHCVIVTGYSLLNNPTTSLRTQKNAIRQTLEPLSSSHYFAINIVLFYMSNVVSILQSCSTPQLVCPLPLTSSSWRPPYMRYQRK